MLTAKSPQYYALTAVNANGESAFSAEVSATPFIPGGLDTNFGAGGLSIYEGGSFDAGRKVLVDATGNILITGSAMLGGGKNMILRRYLPDGSLDTTFASSGMFKTNLTGTDSAEGISMALDGSGRIYVLGRFTNTGINYPSIWVFNNNSSLYGTFGSSGIATFGVSNDIVSDITVTSAGIFITGQKDMGEPNVYLKVWKVTNPGGILDNTYGDIDTGSVRFGYYTYPGPTSSYGNAVVADGTGVLVAGETPIASQGQDLLVFRLDSNGILDTAGFGQGASGKFLHNNAGGSGATSNDSGQDMLKDASGNIYVAGQTTTFGGGAGEMDSVVWKILPDGSALDYNFNTEGFSLFSTGTEIKTRAIAMDGAGGVLVSGDVWPALDSNLFLWRIKPDGVTDLSFGGNGDGVAIFDIAGGAKSFNRGYSLAVDGTNIFVGGDTGNGTDKDMTLWNFLTE